MILLLLASRVMFPSKFVISIIFKIPESPNLIRCRPMFVKESKTLLAKLMMFPVVSSMLIQGEYNLIRPAAYRSKSPRFDRVVVVSKFITDVLKLIVVALTSMSAPPDKRKEPVNAAISTFTSPPTTAESPTNSELPVPPKKMLPVPKKAGTAIPAVIEMFSLTNIVSVDVVTVES